MNKFLVKNSSELISESKDLAEISQWKIVQETEGGYKIVAHISDNLTEPEHFANLICDELNDKRTFPLPIKT